MKKYNRNKYGYNIQLAAHNTPISFEQMWSMNQATQSPGISSNPLAKTYMNAGGDIANVLKIGGGIASVIPGGQVIGAAASGLGSIIGAFSKPSGANPTVGYNNTNPYGYAEGGMIEGGEVEQISPNAMEVTGGEGETDGVDIDYKGMPLAVDNGEMIDTQNDRVFSEKLHDPRTGKSFAESSKKLERLIAKLGKKPSIINMATLKALEKEKEKLFATQETVAQAMGKRQGNGMPIQPGQGMAYGGRMNYAYAGGVPVPINKLTTSPWVNPGKEVNAIRYPSLTNEDLDKYAQDNLNLFTDAGYGNAFGAHNAEGYVPQEEYETNQKRYQAAKKAAGSLTPEQIQTELDTVPAGFKYSNKYKQYAGYHIDKPVFMDAAGEYLKTDEGMRYDRDRKVIDPKATDLLSSPDIFGPNFAALYGQPGFQKIYNDKVKAATQRKENLKDYLVYQKDPTKVLSGNRDDAHLDTSWNDYLTKSGYNQDAAAYQALSNEQKAALINQAVLKANKDNPDNDPYQQVGTDLPPDKQPPDLKYKYGIGDYMQLGAAGLQTALSIFDKPEVNRPRLDRTVITQNKFNPASALAQNQLTTNAARQNLANSYSSAGVASGLQNLYANKYRTDASIINQYDNLNQQARTQYEQRMQQQNQFNAQVQAASDIANEQNRANYTNGLYNSLQTLSNVGKGFNEQTTQQRALEILFNRDPEAYESLMSEMERTNKLTKKKTINDGK